jgi:uncharacterized damage-inducible protein DinB
MRSAAPAPAIASARPRERQVGLATPSHLLMAIANAFVAELEHEASTTRSLLERVPEGAATWKPHPRSYSLGDLAVHLSNVMTWAPATLAQTELDLNPPGGPGWVRPTFESTAKLVATFDANVAAAKAALLATSDADFMVPWTLKNGGTTIFTMPRVVVMRSFVLNHHVHHRGQLSVYLRLQDVPLPPMYGPTADSR